MSRLRRYLDKIDDNKEEADFRSASIRLVESSTVESITESLKKLQETHTDLKKVDKLLHALNRELKATYTGNKFKFALTNESDNHIDSLKVGGDKKDRLRKKWLEFNSELAKIQMDFEER